MLFGYMKVVCAYEKRRTWSLWNRLGDPFLWIFHCRSVYMKKLLELGSLLVMSGLKLVPWVSNFLKLFLQNSSSVFVLVGELRDAVFVRLKIQCG